MEVRGWVWAGGAVAGAAAVTLGGYFAAVGLDDADKLASVIGVFIALAGLGTALYGLAANRRNPNREDARRGGEHEGERGRDDDGTPDVVVLNSEGVQVNNSGGNVQRNSWGNSG